jgi:hypothetical protein
MDLAFSATGGEGSNVRGEGGAERNEGQLLGCELSRLQYIARS